ncbi:hypothetical protein ACFV0L_04040 [Streptosporangium canum]|uniref:hypothetical protein n=1 Tax=Streptosporangium canum TaxID=324952 RepID=UPI0036CA1766
MRLICDHGRTDTEDLGRHLVDARGSSTGPGIAPAIARMVGTPAWRPESQDFIAEAGAGWRTTADGRRLTPCSSEPE